MWYRVYLYLTYYHIKHTFQKYTFQKYYENNRKDEKSNKMMENTTYPFYCYSLFEFEFWFNGPSSRDKFNKQNTKRINVTLFG